MTDHPGLPPLDEDPSTLDLARRALATADGIAANADRDPIAAAISQAGGYQRAYLVHANALAAIATAELLEQILTLLRERLQWPPR